MNLVQLGSILTQQVSELEKVSSCKAGVAGLSGMQHYMFRKGSDLLNDQREMESRPHGGLSGWGLRWPPRQYPGHIQFGDSKSWKSRQVMHS